MAALNSLIQLHTIPTGRRTFAHRGVLTEAEARGLTSLVTHVKASVTHDEQTRTVELAWEAAKKRNDTDPEAVPLDLEIDALLGNVVDYLSSIAGSPLPSKSEAEHVLTELFPNGKAGLTQLPHEEQASAVAVVLARLGGDLKGAAKALGLKTHIEQLTTLNGRMQALLGKVKRDKGPTWSEVRARQTAGQERIVETVARILGAHPSGSDEDVAARAALLAPILKQNEEVRLSRRRRQQVSDVDPTTGVPVASDDVPEPADVDG